MAYSDFTIAELKRRFKLEIAEGTGLFADSREVDIPESLGLTLTRFLPLAVNMNTEKARSELLIAPLLAEFKLLHRDRISLFSGIEFTVDEADGLKGRCDFILARSPDQFELEAPVCMVVEAKNENIVAGIPQCLAELVAAQRLNERAGRQPTRLHGVVTTGVLWRFLELDGTRARIDSTEYPIHLPRKIFGILTATALGDS